MLKPPSFRTGDTNMMFKRLTSLLIFGLTVQLQTSFHREFDYFDYLWIILQI